MNCEPPDNNCGAYRTSIALTQTSLANAQSHQSLHYSLACDALRPSQHFFSRVGTFPGLIQYKAEDKDTSHPYYCSYTKNLR